MYRYFISVFSLLSLVSLPLAAEEGLTQVPKWELGVAGVAFNVPDYPASDQNNWNFAGAPFFIYRGDFLRVGDGSTVRGVFFENDYVQFDLSFGGAFDVESEENDARRGMRDLDFIGEVGPALRVYALRSALLGDLFFQLPVRAAFETDLSYVEHRGFVTEPEVNYLKRNILDTGLNLSLRAGSYFGTEDYNDTFYEVTSADVTASRPLYNAEAGYIGSEASAGMSFPVTDGLRIFTNARVGWWNGSANESSPLYRQDVTYGFGGGLVWSFYQSDEKVTRRVQNLLSR
jgi:outer membrane protein